MAVDDDRHRAYFSIWKALNDDDELTVVVEDGTTFPLSPEIIRQWYEGGDEKGLQSAMGKNEWLRITWPLHHDNDNVDGLADKLRQDDDLRKNLSHEAVRWAAMAIGENGKKFAWLSQPTKPDATLVTGDVGQLDSVLEAHPLLGATKDITRIHMAPPEDLTAKKLSYLAQLVAMETFFHKGVQLFDGRPESFSARTMVGIANGIPREEELGDLTSRLKPERALMDNFMPGYMQAERRAVRPGAAPHETGLGKSWRKDFKENVLRWTINGKDDPSFRELTGAVHNVIADRFDGNGEAEADLRRQIANLQEQITALTTQRDDLREDLALCELNLTSAEDGLSGLSIRVNTLLGK